MNRLLLALFFCGTLALSAAEQSKTSNGNATLTGCIDEQPGPRYALHSPTDLRLTAQLEPEGFPVEAFAKYLGKRVTVQGRLSSGSEPPVMRVKTIKELAGACSGPGETRKQASGKTVMITLTGCMDEQPGPKYVLLAPDTAEPIAELEPAGFEVQNLARFVGHSVSVRGERGTDRTPPVLRIKQFADVKNVADQCVPR